MGSSRVRLEGVKVEAISASGSSISRGVAPGFLPGSQGLRRVREHRILGSGL